MSEFKLQGNYNFSEQEEQPQGFKLRGSYSFNQPTPAPEQTQQRPSLLTPQNTLEILQQSKNLTKEDIISSPEYMDIIRGSLAARSKIPSSTVGSAVTSITGGQTFDGIEGKDDEELFEMWQNWQRSFAGGQTITSANELLYMKNAGDEEKNKIGAGYMLFDNMTNAFVGEGSWAETGDAVRDYGKAAIWDPTTILSLGIGRAITGGTSKVATAAARKAVVQGFKQRVAAGVPSQIARTAAKAQVAKQYATHALAYSVGDIAANVGADIAYQAARMETDAQDEYSALQTAIVGIGTTAIPAIMATSGIIKIARNKIPKDAKGLMADISRYVEIDDKVVAAGRKNAPNVIQQNTNIDQVIKSLDDQFGKIEGDTTKLPAWLDMKKESGRYLNKEGRRLTDSDILQRFTRYLYIGDPETGVKGYAQALKEAGFVMHEELLKKYETNPTGVIAKTLEWLPEGTVDRYMKQFEKSTGAKLNIGRKNADFAKYVINNASVAGQTLQISSQSSKILKKSVDDLRVMLDDVAKEADQPKKLQFALSTYKRLLTSHLATTGANLKGFGIMVGMDTLSDVALTSMQAGKWAVHKGLRQGDKAERALQEAWGIGSSVLGKGLDIVSPDMSFDYALKIFELDPKSYSKLFRDVSGDGGVLDALSTFNLDPNNKILGAVDGTTKALQTVTGVRMQDEVTKLWAFQSNLSQAIRREYGQTPQEFFNDSKFVVEMGTDRFKNRVMEKALYRTMRETASVNWSLLPTNNAFRQTAKFIEMFTNKTPFGFVVPFGSFLNTTIATMADYTFVNAMFHYAGKVTGKQYDYATQEGAELLAKGAAGLTAIGIGIYSARERIREGLAWDQQKNSDGSIQEITFDWPASTMRLMSQILAHAENPQTGRPELKRIPEDLWRELGQQLGGQSVRDLDDVVQTLTRSMEGFRSDEVGLKSFWENLIAPAVARVSQGITRPLDPLNQLTGLVRGRTMNPDLRQGAENFNQATKYIRHLVNAQELPRRMYPTSDARPHTDIGKQLLGVRSPKANTLIEKMLNTTGRTHWNQTQWDGPPEIKNFMDALAQPIFEREARFELNKHPEFFEEYFSDFERNNIMDNINAKVSEQVLKHLDETPIAKTVNALRLLSEADKEKVAKAKEWLGIEGDLEELLEEPDGLQQLLKIQNVVDSYDEIFLD